MYYFDNTTFQIERMMFMPVVFRGELEKYQSLYKANLSGDLFALNGYYATSSSIPKPSDKEMVDPRKKPGDIGLFCFQYIKYLKL